MSYKDPEKAKEAKKEWARRHRQEAKDCQKGSTNVEPDCVGSGKVEPDVEPMAVEPVEPEGVTPGDDLVSRLSKIEERLQWPRKRSRSTGPGWKNWLPASKSLTPRMSDLLPDVAAMIPMNCPSRK